jgi:hypothetical protein
MTELERVRIVEDLFPDWKEHLSDGKVLDQVLDGLSCHKVVVNKCSRAGCNNVARRDRKTCLECAEKAARYMRTYERKTKNVTQSAPEDNVSDPTPSGSLTAQLAV